MSWPVSDDYRQAIKRSHRICTRLEVLRYGSTQDVLKIAGGSVTVDSAQSIRRTMQIPLLDRAGDLVPGIPSDLLHIVGNELRAWRGIDFGDDRPGIPDGVAPRGCELVPLITGPLYENDADDQGGGIALSLQCYDRARYIADAPWDDHYIPTPGNYYTDVIMAAIRDRLPASLTVSTDNVDFTTELTPAGLGTGNNSSDDPMTTLIRWALNIGMDLAFDPLGDPFLRETPDPVNDQPVASYSDQRGELFSVRKRLSRETVYNWITVTGESPGGGAPVRAVVKDEDPNSPTYVEAMGPKRFEYTSELIRSELQALRTATSLLRQKSGISETVSFGANVDGSLDVFDVVELERARMKISARYALEAFSVPLDPETPGDFAVRHRRTN